MVERWMTIPSVSFMVIYQGFKHFFRVQYIYHHMPCMYCCDCYVPMNTKISEHTTSFDTLLLLFIVPMEGHL